MKIPILYEDADIVAINKPAGLVVHSDGKTVEPFLTDWILKNYPKTKNVGEPMEVKVQARKGITDEAGNTTGASPQITKTIERRGIVHRLDRETSGVLLIAKTAEAHALLKTQFQDHTITKKYHTFVYGEMKEKWGIIKRPIGRSTKDFRKWSAQRGARGELREAETWWNLIKTARVSVDGINDNPFSFVEVEPKTGRTHQIRVHFKAINHPVICDPLYAGEKPPALGFTRTALHASEVSFTNVAGKRIMVHSPFPEDFLYAMKEMGVEDVVVKQGLSKAVSRSFGKGSGKLPK